ncbi:unnamed protein product [Cunninghamella echinulata]
MFATTTTTTTKVMTPIIMMAAGYVTYARTTAQPALAYSHIMTSQGTDKSGKQQWKELNNGLGLVDVSRSCGGL